MVCAKAKLLGTSCREHQGQPLSVLISGHVNKLTLFIVFVSFPSFLPTSLSTSLCGVYYISRARGFSTNRLIREEKLSAELEKNLPIVPLSGIMKLVILSLGFIVALCLLMSDVSAANNGKYTNRYDNIDLDEILRNNRLYKKYFDCLARDGKCTPDARELKQVLPEALKTACAKCTQKQKQGSEKVIKFLIEKKPRDYDVLEAKYDPTGVYRAKYREEAKKRGIKI